MLKYITVSNTYENKYCIKMSERKREHLKKCTSTNSLREQFMVLIHSSIENGSQKKCSQNFSITVLPEKNMTIAQFQLMQPRP